MSFISKDFLTLIKQELLIRNNVFTVCYSHNESVIKIGYNVIFLQESTGAWYTDSKIKRLDISFY